MVDQRSAILSSWKEIATYLGKGVRTVQRWERELQLPVRRPIAHNRRIVIAVPAELDLWVKQQVPRAAANRDARVKGRHVQQADLQRMAEVVKRVQEEAQRVHDSTERLLKLCALGEQRRRKDNIKPV